MRGKSYTVFTGHENWKSIKEKTAYIIGSDGRVNTATAYTVYNLIVTPGKEIFILINPKTGKQKRARNIFVAA